MKKTYRFIYFISFIWFVPSAYCQLMVDPVQLNLETSAGTTDINLEFASNPEYWTATVNVDWLSMEVQEGEGPMSIGVEYDANEGPRRSAEITFRTESDSLVLEVRQFMVFEPENMQFLFTAIDRPFRDPGKVPYAGHMQFWYQPWETGLFMSVVAKSDLVPDPVWIIRNLYVPSAEWADIYHQLGTRFDLGELGYEYGQPVENIQFSWTLSFIPDSIIPFIPSTAWIDEIVENLTADPDRILDDLLYNDSLSDSTAQYHLRQKLPASITDLKFVGCRMVNGDLDYSKYPEDSNGCAPAAAANSLLWLENENDNIDIPGEWRDAYKELRGLMKTTRKKGTNQEDFIRAKLDFIEAHNLPISVKFQSHKHKSDIASSSGNSVADCQNEANKNGPTRDFLVKELKDDEDVELFTSPIISTPADRKKIGHVVTLTGTVTINGKTYFYYKHDPFQNMTDTNYLVHDLSPIEARGGFIYFPVLDGVATLAVSESPDPNHATEPNKEFFSKYCKSFKRIIPPGGSLKIKYPKNDKRCFNSTVRVLSRSASDFSYTAARWNFNSGKTRTFKNDKDHPVTVEIHNDDYRSGSGMKTYLPYEVEVQKILSDPYGQTDSDNSDVYGGFSIGSDDDEGFPFVPGLGNKTVFTDSLFNSMGNFPQFLSEGLMDTLLIKRQVDVWNRYWKSLDLVLGVDSVKHSGQVYLSSIATGFQDTVDISQAGEIIIPIGGMDAPGMFDLQMIAANGLHFFFDNVGIAASFEVKMQLSIDKKHFELPAELTIDTSFMILNLGGESMDWALSYSSNWFAASPRNGTDETEIRLFVVPNKGAPRKDSIRVVASGAEDAVQYVVVSQDGDASGIEHLEVFSKMEVYPNPAHDILYLRWQNLSTEPIRIRIYNLKGEVVEDQVYYKELGDQGASIGLSQYPKGLYILSMVQGERKGFQKLIIQ